MPPSAVVSERNETALTDRDMAFAFDDTCLMAAFHPKRTSALSRIPQLFEAADKVLIQCLHVFYSDFNSEADEIAATLLAVAWSTGEDEVVQVILPAISLRAQMVSRAVV